MLRGLALLILLHAAPDVMAQPPVNSWSANTQTRPAEDENPACPSLRGTALKHVTAISHLQGLIEKDASAPPRTIKGLVKTWMGEPHANAALVKKRSQLDKERSLIEDLNRLAASLGCMPVDVEAELTAIGPKVVAPELPDR